MRNAIGYLRVSTREQARSGLSLEAQRRDIESLGEREGFSVTSWYQDIQTGGGANALLLRLGLATGLREGQGNLVSAHRVQARSPLARAHFIAGPMVNVH
jgi:DNA invertase Pin-like site-specific DNA recombinase